MFSWLHRTANSGGTVPPAPPLERRRHPERRSGLRALYNREVRVRCAAQEVGFGTYELDCVAGLIHWSSEVRGIAGLPQDDNSWSVEAMQDLIHPDDRERIMDSFQAAQAPDGNGEFDEEYRLLRPDGTVAWVRGKGRTFFYGDGQHRHPLGATGVIMDITDRKVREQMLQDRSGRLESEIRDSAARLGEATEALEYTNLELQQFAYIAAHDMQTPLRSISGFSQLLKKEYRGRLDAQADVWLDQLVSAAQRMNFLIRDLLAYSCGDGLGRPFEATSMNTVFDEILSSAEPIIREIGATVTRGDLPTVMGDPVQLAQLLHNLIENGIKYRSDKPARVHVAASRRGNDWEFSVKDNGIGIDKKHHQQIFNIFQRLHTQQAYAGTGIGLAICRRVVQRHGGEIWVESSAPEEGSTFSFTLPSA